MSQQLLDDKKPLEKLQEPFNFWLSFLELLGIRTKPEQSSTILAATAATPSSSPSSMSEPRADSSSVAASSSISTHNPSSPFSGENFVSTGGSISLSLGNDIPPEKVPIDDHFSTWVRENPAVWRPAVEKGAETNPEVRAWLNANKAALDAGKYDEIAKGPVPLEVFGLYLAEQIAIALIVAFKAPALFKGSELEQLLNERSTTGQVGVKELTEALTTANEDTNLRARDPKLADAVEAFQKLVDAEIVTTRQDIKQARMDEGSRAAPTPTPSGNAIPTDTKVIS